MSTKARVDSLYRAGRSFYQRSLLRYPLTFYTLILAVIVLTREQIWNILDLRWPHASMGDWLWTTTKTSYVVLNGLAAFVAAFLVVPRSRSTKPGRSSPIETLSLLAHGWEPLDRFSELLIQLKRKVGGANQQKRLGLLLFLIGLGWLILPAFVGRPPLPFRVTHTLLLFGLAGWFAAPLPDAPTRLHRALGRYLLWTSLGIMVGGLMWYLPSIFPEWLSFRFYTIWAMGFLLFLFLATAQFLDAVPGREGSLLRVLAPIAVIAYLGVSTGVFVDTGQISAATTDAAWFNTMASRIETMPPGPVLIVAASGGGSRAAMFTSMVLEALAHQEVGESKGAGKSVLSQNVALISAVSGGSLASANYLHRIDQTGPDSQNSPSSLSGSLARAINMLAKAYYNDYLQQVGPNPAGELQKRRLEAYERVVAETEQLPKQSPEIAPWLFTSQYIDDMATDFMAPVLRGVLTPVMERGQSLADFWTERFKWGDRRQRSRFPQSAPLLILNATNVDSGRRVVIGFPPIPPSLLGGRVQRAAYDLRLADAVRLSANFPWGFEIARLHGDTPDKEESIPEWKLLDGGVTDNTGIDTIAAFFESIEYFSQDSNVSPFETESQTEFRLGAKKVRNLLLERGAMLIEIDSGAKPGGSPILGSVLPGYTDPIKALSRAGYLSAEQVKSSHLNALETALDRMSRHNDLETSQPISEEGSQRRFLHVRFVCNHADNVMTAWALGFEDKAKLHTLFLIEAAERLPELNGGFEILRLAKEESQSVTDERQQVHQTQILEEFDMHQKALANEELKSAQDRRGLYKGFANQAVPYETEPPAGLRPSQSPLRSGWVYLGHYDGGQWRTRYFSLVEATPLEPPGTLAAGDVLRVLSRSNVRLEMPGPSGEFRDVEHVLRAGDEIVLANPPLRWEDSGYYWAEVQYREK